MFRGKSILVTGGTGSFGKRFIAHILTNYPEVERIAVYSRDELKQFDMATSPEFANHQDKLRFFLGDVRDGERLKMACEGIDTIIHAAALKQVPAAEYNPMECIKTNILGAENVINAALSGTVKTVIALSTDKAAAPINLYGATKLCSDKLFIAANNMKGKRDLKFSVVRYGNVLGSRGSVVPFFLKKRKTGVLPITSEEMTRFSLTLDESIAFVMMAIEKSWGGELFIPKIPSYRINDLAKAICTDCKIEIVGLRAGEKIHEEMITESDSLNTVDCGNYFVILPTTGTWNKEEFLAKCKAKMVKPGFRYNSGENDHWLTVSEIRQLIKTHVDPTFEA
jgi:UDP-N-acetylglucosamine 4,6-dehydratase